FSYCYSSSDESFSYVSDPCYCPVHYAPPVNTCAIHQPYAYYTNNGNINVQPVRRLVDFLLNKFGTRRFSSEQIRILEEHFYKVDKYLSKVTIDELSTRTQLKPAQIRVWFSNKRTRERQ
ncbi:unnamed protein product, partial [Rotaria socialis]